MKSAIYTKGGDRGMTSLIGGTRVPKCDLRLDAYGTVDELNSFIGLLIAQLFDEEEKTVLLKIQHKLFSVGGYLATDQDKTALKTGCKIKSTDIEVLEQQIDKLDEQLPPIKAFILPGGSQSAATAHVCRTVCRRTERRILELAQKSTIDELLIGYMNRLSDYFFILARKLCLEELKKEIIWEKSFDE